MCHNGSDFPTVRVALSKEDVWIHRLIAKDHPSESNREPTEHSLFKISYSTRDQSFIVSGYTTTKKTDIGLQ